MKKSTIVCLVLLVTLLSQEIFADVWTSDKFSKTLHLALADDSIAQLYIDAGAGDLKITGKAGQLEITVIAKVFGEKLNEDEYVLSLQKDGDKARLIAQFNDNIYNNQRIDLEISMPPTLALLVDDRSGDILIESISNGLTLNDRSGGIDLKGVVGDVNINDSSGDIHAKNISGVVIVADSSGDISINGAADF